MADHPTGPGSRWDGSRAGDYDQAWQRLVDRGENPHGEVDLVQRFEPTSVLDAGCGTGRVGLELARRGVDVVGVDLDESMLAVARDKCSSALPGNIEWVHADLAGLELGRDFDVVVMAGNIVLFVAPGTEAQVVAGAARHVGPGGVLIAGFSSGRGVTVDQWESWVGRAGLSVTARHSTWDGAPHSPDSDYLVSIAQRLE